MSDHGVKEDFDGMKRRIKAAEFLKAHLSWRGEVDDVAWSVAHWGADHMNEAYGEHHGMWNFYLHIPASAFADDTFDAQLWLTPSAIHERSNGSKWPTYDDYNSALADLPWHGGITHYSKEVVADGDERSIKVGCDYGHSFDRDRGYQYDLEYVRHDAERAARAFREKFPTMLWRCSWSGRWYPKNQMIPNKHGKMVGADQKQKIPAGWGWFPEEQPAA